MSNIKYHHDCLGWKSVNIILYIDDNTKNEQYNMNGMIGNIRRTNSA